MTLIRIQINLSDIEILAWTTTVPVNLSDKPSVDIKKLQGIGCKVSRKNNQ